MTAKNFMEVLGAGNRIPVVRSLMTQRNGKPGPIHALAFNANSRHLAFSNGPTVFVVDMTGKQLAKFSLPSTQGIYSLKYCNKGRYLFAANTGHYAVLDSRRYKPVRKLQGKFPGVMGRFDVDFRLRAAVGIKGTGVCAAAFPGLSNRTALTRIAHPGARHVRFGPNAKYVVTCGADGVKVWNARSGALVCTVSSGNKTTKRYPVTFDLDPTDSSRLAVGTLDGRVELWSLPAGKLLAGTGWVHRPTYNCSYPLTECVRFSPDGRLLASSGKGVVKLWLLDDGGLTYLNSVRRAGDIVQIAVSPDNRKLALCTYIRNLPVSKWPTIDKCTEAQKNNVQVYDISRLRQYHYAAAMYESSWDAHTKKRFAAIKEKAEAGNGDYQAVLARAYAVGWPAPVVDYDLARQWLETSVAQKSELGLLWQSHHLSNKFLAADHSAWQFIKAQKTAAACLPQLTKRAQAGDGFAIWALASYYMDVKKDPKLASEWARKGEKYNHPEIHLILARLYRLGGGGVQKDQAKALKHFEIAARMGLPRALSALARYHRDGRLGLVRSRDAAFVLAKKAADRKYFDGLFQVGEALHAGTACPPDFETGRKYLNQAVAMGSTDAIRVYGDLHLRGVGLPQNTEKGLQLLARAAARSDFAAARKLGAYYSKRKDAAAAFKWYDRIGDPRARELDKRLGLAFLYQFVSFRGAVGEPAVTVPSRLQKGLAAHKTGLPDIGDQIIEKTIAAAPEDFYRSRCDLDFPKTGVPLRFASALYVKALAEKWNQYDFLLWLTYGHMANLAGRPELALKAADKLAALLPKFAKKGSPGRELLTAAATIRAGALIQLGETAKGYSSLYEGFKLDLKDGASIDRFVNYVNNQATPLLTDRKKLAFVTGIPAPRFKGEPRMPKAQAYHDLATGKLLQAATGIPALQDGGSNDSDTTAAEAVKPAAEAKPEAEAKPDAKEPKPIKVIILD